MDGVKNYLQGAGAPPVREGTDLTLSYILYYQASDHLALSRLL